MRETLIKTKKAFFIQAAFLFLVTFFFFSCASDLNSDPSDNSNGSRKLTGGNISINLYLYYAPKTVTYGRAPNSVTDAFQANIWAWKKISKGDVNYTTNTWPGGEEDQYNDLAMIPYDKDGNPLDVDEDSSGNIKKKPTTRTTLNDADPDNSGHKIYEKIAYWKLTLKADQSYDFGILFVDVHAKTKQATGDQFDWVQTNDVVVPKDKIKQGANIYFIYGKNAFYDSYEESQGLKSAEVIDTAGSKVNLTLYNDGDAFDATNFIVTESTAEVDRSGVVTSGATLTVTSLSDVSSTGLTLTVTKGSATPPYKVYYKRVIESTEGGVTTQTVVLSDPVYAYYRSDILDAAGVVHEADDLGITFNNDGTTTFRTWSPTAESVKVLLFTTLEAAGQKGKNINKWSTVPKEAPCDESILLEMARTTPATGSVWDGTWELKTTLSNTYNYYKYRLTFIDKKLTSKEKLDLNKLSGSTKDRCEWVNTIECKRLEGETRTYDVPDIWGKVAAPDGVATQILTIDDKSTKPEEWEATYTNPFSPNGDPQGQVRPYSDAVIYEMNVADWAEGCAGKYSDLSKDEIISHLKDLGVTHVALMPIMDNVYTDKDDRYNWGFCPYNFNIPESRYARDPSSGATVIKETRAMIKKLHDAGISVIMDVAFSHTGNNKNGVESQSLYDSTVPQYFYRIMDGVYSNGANQGSELATGHKMTKKYIISCLKHWMEDYHINGFSFYLLSLMEKTTITEIYNALYEIDHSVMILGEPWESGRKSALESGQGVSNSIKTAQGNGVATFDDSLRTAVKGKELRGFTRGQVQGYYQDALLNRGLTLKGDEKITVDGSDYHLYNTTDLPGLTIHYTEIHDDNTLFDKLLLSMSSSAGVGSYKEDTVPLFSNLYTEKLSLYIDEIKAQDKLAAAYTILSQGTPFISAGQEFLRTKQGNPDSSEAGKRREHAWLESVLKDCNKQDLTLREKYDDVYSVYRGLIALKKANPQSFGGNSLSTAETLSGGVTKYSTTGFTVYFNATGGPYPISDEGYIVSVDGGFSETGYDAFAGHTFNSTIAPYSISTTKERVSQIPRKGFLILKK